MRAGRLRRARPGRPDARHRARAGSRVVEVETQHAVAVRQSLLFGYVAQFLYEGDSPLAERRAAALALDPSLLAELLGRGEGLALRDLLDPEAVARTEAELQRLDARAGAPRRRGRRRPAARARARCPSTAIAGPLPRGRRPATTSRPGSPSCERRPPGDRGAGRRRGALGGGRGRRPAARRARASRCRSGVPAGLPRAGRRPARRPGRPLRPHPRARSTPPRSRPALGLGPAVAHDALRRLVVVGPGRRGRVAAHRRRRHASSATPRCCAMLRRRSLAALRAEVEPVRPADAGPLPAGAGRASAGGCAGVDGLLRVVEQLAGAVLPASALETLVLPGRVADYSPALLDELTATGEVLWCGHGSLPGDDGWVSLHLADSAHAHPARSRPRPGARPSAIRRCSTRSPAAARTSSAPCPTPVGVDRRPGPRHDALGPGLVGAGHRRHPGAAAGPAVRRAHRPPPHAQRPAPHPVRRPPRPARRARRRIRRAPRCRRAPARRRSPGAGRCCRRSSPTPPLRAYATAELLLDRHGVADPRARRPPRTCRAGSPPSTGCWPRSRRPAGCAAATSSRGSAPSQFGTTGAVDRLRGGSGSSGAGRPGRGRADRRGARRQRPGQPVRRRARLAGPRGRPGGRRRRRRRADAQPPTSAGGTGRAARPAPSSCSSTASSSSTSSAAARRCSPAPTTPTRCRRPPTRWPLAVRRRRLGRLTVETADGGQVLGSGPPPRRGPRGGRLPRSPRAGCGCAGERACPRVTPCTAPPTGSTPPCAARVVERADLRWPVGARRRPQRVAHRSRSWPAASTCCTGSTPGRRCTPTCGWRVSGGSSTRARAPSRRCAATTCGPPCSPPSGRRSACASACSTSCRPPRESDLVGHLGPDVLGPDWDADGGGARGSRHPAAFDRRRAARPAGAGRGRHLLGQRDPVPRAGAALDAGGRPRPRACASSSTGCTALMDTARRTGRQVSTGVPRRGEEAYVHARSGRPCRRCGDTVRVAMTGAAAAPAHDVLLPAPARAAWRRPTTAGRSGRWAAAAAPRPQAVLGRGGRDGVGHLVPDGQRRRRGECLDPLDALTHQLEHLGQAAGRGRCRPRRAARRRPPSCRARAH